ncbi:MAG: adenine deaminase [Proteobacteria bacterium]|nr:adenine deaminase [Pseudomonadota bacterium]
MRHEKSQFKDTASLARAIDYARGLIKVPCLIRNAKWLDVFSGSFQTGDLAWADGKIIGVGENYEATQVIDGEGLFLVPGFIDSHVHIESSLMTPARFQELALLAGTTSAIWDPHEIANVWGRQGIDWALAASRDLLLDIFVMIPSCVPSTNSELAFESSGAQLNAADIESYRQNPKVLGLAELMNVPGLLYKDPDILNKLLNFQEMRRDGHCPGVLGKDLNAYALAGIHSCHESTTADEARTKLSKGIHVLIREGSCAKDADALLPLLDAYSSTHVALCSDDRNPLDIMLEGHINVIINKALRQGHEPRNIFRAASFAAARMYGLNDRGVLAPGYAADFCLIEPIDAEWTKGMRVKKVWKSGKLVKAEELTHVASHSPGLQRQNLQLPTPSPQNLKIPHKGRQALTRVIGVIPGKILTRNLSIQLPVLNQHLEACLDQDILKICVFERHRRTGYHALGFVQGFGIKSGAIATSINHDSHNIIAVGSSDDCILAAINDLIDIDGGIVVRSASGQTAQLPLPIAGLMSDARPETIAEQLRCLKALAQSIGCTLHEPFLQLSFLALPVIPSLKITDRGLIDVDAFCKVSLVIDEQE